MREQPATGGSLDFEAMRHAIEKRDAETLVGFYAEDAELHTVNRNTTPSSPEVLRGKEQIAQHLRDVCGREMTHSSGMRYGPSFSYQRYFMRSNTIR